LRDAFKAEAEAEAEIAEMEALLRQLDDVDSAPTFPRADPATAAGDVDEARVCPATAASDIHAARHSHSTTITALGRPADTPPAHLMGHGIADGRTDGENGADDEPADTDESEEDDDFLPPPPAVPLFVAPPEPVPQYTYYVCRLATDGNGASSSWHPFTETQNRIIESVTGLATAHRLLRLPMPRVRLSMSRVHLPMPRVRLSMPRAPFDVTCAPVDATCVCSGFTCARSASLLMA
jgi:hypothetical protein